MYHRFYGLSELPFELTPDPKYLFLTSQHREALSNLQYGLCSAKPLTVLVGEAGTGKTTLLHAALESDACRKVHWVCLSNPVLTPEDFFRTLAARFALGAPAAESKAVFLDRFERLLRRRRSRGEITALIVDEAQSLSYELLEEIRLLGNIETPSAKLLLLVLAGQPELGSRLNAPELTQLKQRIALRCEIAPFGLSDTAAYIASRISTAGGDSAQLFTREAVVAIHDHSGGILRTINVLCDNALLDGFALGRQPVDREIVLDVGRDFHLTPQPGQRPAPASSPVDRPAPNPSESSADPNPEPSSSPGLIEESHRRRFVFFSLARGLMSRT